MIATFEIRRDANRKIYFELVGGDGRILLTGRGYSVICAAEKAAESVRRNAGDSARYRAVAGESGESRLVLTAANGALLAVSHPGLNAEDIAQFSALVAEVSREAEIVDKRPGKTRSPVCGL